MFNTQNVKNFFLKKNIIANILFYLGIIVIFASFYLISQIFEDIKPEFQYYSEVPFSLLIYTQYFTLPAFVFFIGIVLIGLSEGIELLQRIVDKKKEDVIQTEEHKSIALSEVSSTSVENNYLPKDDFTIFSESKNYNRVPQTREIKPYDPNAVPVDIQNQIKEFYSKKGATPIRFYHTPFINTFLVEFENRQFHAVLTNHFGVSGEIHKNAWSDEMLQWFNNEGFNE